MKVGLYFGSFNPVHHGHLIIAKYILNTQAVQQVWMVLSPQNPHKKSNTLLNEHNRLHLLQLALQDDEQVKANSVEFGLPKPSYTSDTLAYLSQKYPAYNFTIIMGSDSYQNIKNWKNADFILTNYKVLVYQRPGFDKPDTIEKNVEFIDAPLLDISSTYIRKLIKKKQSITYLLPQKVEEYILENKYYR